MAGVDVAARGIRRQRGAKSHTFGNLVEQRLELMKRRFGRRRGRLRTVRQKL